MGNIRFQLGPQTMVPNLKNIPYYAFFRNELFRNTTLQRYKSFLILQNIFRGQSFSSSPNTGGMPPSFYVSGVATAPWWLLTWVSLFFKCVFQIINRRQLWFQFFNHLIGLIFCYTKRLCCYPKVMNLQVSLAKLASPVIVQAALAQMGSLGIRQQIVSYISGCG